MIKFVEYIFDHLGFDTIQAVKDVATKPLFMKLAYVDKGNLGKRRRKTNVLFRRRTMRSV